MASTRAHGKARLQGAVRGDTRALVREASRGAADGRVAVAEACRSLGARYELLPVVLTFVERSTVYLHAAHNAISGLSKDQEDPIVHEFSSAFENALERAHEALEALEPKVA